MDAALGAELDPKQLQVKNDPGFTVEPTAAVKPLAEVVITVRFPDDELIEQNGFDMKTAPKVTDKISLFNVVGETSLCDAGVTK